MDIATLGQFVGSVGFPCAIAIIMSYLLLKEKDAHMEESKMLTRAINKLEITMAKIGGVPSSNGEDKNGMDS